MTTLKRTGLGLLTAGALWATPALGQIGGLLPTADNPPTRQGTRGANFLHIGIGAVGNSMAGAIGSSVKGPTAWFWNPAGAANTEAFSGAAGRQSLYGDLGVHQTYAAISVPLLGGVAGLSFNTLASGDIVRTSEAFPFGRPGQGFQFQWNSTAAGLGYARRLTDRLSVGGQARYITEGITGASSQWLAFDVGTHFNTGIYGFVLAGALQQLGGAGKMTGPLLNRQFDNAVVNRERTRTDLFVTKLDLPTAFRFSLGNELYGSAESALGGAGGPHRLYTEVALNDAVDLATQYAVGAEYSFKNAFFVRGGKKMFNDDRETGTSSSKYGLSGGFGVRLPLAGRDARFDYSYTSLGNLKDMQVFSFEIGR